jgi:hypothetical protein
MTPVQRLTIANFATGYETDREPFLIDNDAFPVLQNMYQWRGRILKKRGTFLLGRLQRYIPANATRPHTGTSNIAVLSGAGGLAATSLISVFTLQAAANIVPGSLSLSDGVNTYTDNSAGVITGTPAGSGTINYATSSITIAGGAAGGTLVGSFQYYPNLPVMGLRNFNVSSALQPNMVAFDTVYSYQYDQSNSIFYDTSFYKGTLNPVVWSGQDYQQFWTTNYYGAMWATNNKPGFNFKSISGITQANPGVVTINAHGLITGDRIWVNEVGGMTQINGQTLSVTVLTANTFSIGIDTTGYGAYTSGGIAQYLTSRISGQDGIKWYDGDPTASSGLGWVNFAPPLDNTATPNYLVGALAILPFKDRLLVFGPYIQKSNAGTATLLQDQVMYSQNGTPFYNSLVPTNPSNPQTAPSNSSAWVQNIVGFGGFISAGTQQAIVSVMNNEDVLLVDFVNRKTKLVYTSNDLLPFLFYNINSELGTESTFSAITLDAGALSMGQYGLAMTTQNSAQRIDLLIPDQIFDVKQTDSGPARVSAVRDFRNEFIYFTYPSIQNPWKFPTQTLVFNYRDNTWALFLENYTTYGNFRRTSPITWASLPYTSWSAWTDPWNLGKDNSNYPFISAGNQQGFVVLKDDKGITEAQSEYIQSITIVGSTVTINSPNHCLNTGEYIYIQNCIGVSGINSTIRQVTVVDTNNFRVDSLIPVTVPSGTYLGGGTFSRLTIPIFQTKQFPSFWADARRTRIGTQRYLFDETSDGEVTINLYLSQDGGNSANQPPIYPSQNPYNSSVIFTQTVLTSPEPSDLFETQYAQAQIWHRMNTSLIGDTVQIGLTLSDSQMRDYPLNNSDIVLHSILIDLYPSGVLAI